MDRQSSMVFMAILFEQLRCVDCYQEMDFSGDRYICVGCGRDYLIDASDIIQALPRKKTLLPEFYHYDFYQNWLQRWTEIVKNWFIYSNPFYRFFSMSGHRQVHQYLKKYLRTTDILLDLGCGPGQMLTLVDHPHYVAVDHNLDFLRILKLKYPHVLAIQADILNLPFSNNQIDVVLSAHTLEHIYLLAESLQEIKRILKPIGNLIFTIPTEGGWGWNLGRRLITQPTLKKQYQLDAQKIMAIEHINDAKRVLKFIEFYFKIDSLHYAPFSWLPFLGINSSISGRAKII